MTNTQHTTNNLEKDPDYLVSSICSTAKEQWVSSSQTEEEEIMLYMVSSQTIHPNNNNWVLISLNAIEQNNKNVKFSSELNLILSREQLKEFIDKGSMTYNNRYGVLKFIVSNNPRANILSETKEQ